MTSMTPYKYPKMLIRAIVLVLLAAALPLGAQYRRPPEVRKTPRALAVLEFDSTGRARLFPVMIMLEGKFYDGSLYGSKPVPMALWSETVYEAQKSGMPMGLFTVASALRLQSLWWGQGNWKPFASSKEPKKTETKPAAKDATKEKPAPKLKGDEDPDRPVLKKPVEKAAESPAPEPAQAARSSASPEDSDRPTLRRGKPKEGSQVQEEPFQILDPAKTKPVFGEPVETLLAISDPAPSDSRPFDMQLSPEEQERYEKELTRQAWAEVRKFAGTRSTIPANATFTEVRIRSFDLDYSNNPLFVFMAEYRTMLGVKLPSGELAKRPITYFITYVGRADMNGAVNRVFARATDTTRLDAYSRLEFVDVVDADGDSRGELLFRDINDLRRRYALYRASPYWSKMFEGASGQ